MGTNYYAIPKVEDLEKKRQKLIEEIQSMDVSNPGLCEDGFRIHEDGWDRFSPWDKFTEETSVHLGKRSSGWKFCWNFNNNKYYSSKAELIAFVLSRRIVNEYREEQDPQEFLDMAFDWGQPDGLVADKDYFDKTNHHSWMTNLANYHDREVDGLRVSSSTQFS
jgi:hypothetical protein